MAAPELESVMAVEELCKLTIAELEEEGTQCQQVP